MNHGQDRCFSNLLMQQAANPGVGTASRSRLSMRLGPRCSRESQAALIRPRPSPPEIMGLGQPRGTEPSDLQLRAPANARSIAFPAANLLQMDDTALDRNAGDWNALALGVNQALDGTIRCQSDRKRQGDQGGSIPPTSAWYAKPREAAERAQAAGPLPLIRLPLLSLSSFQIALIWA